MARLLPRSAPGVLCLLLPPVLPAFTMTLRLAKALLQRPDELLRRRLFLVPRRHIHFA